MTFKNILFVISFVFILPCHGFSGLDFLHKQNNAKKSAMAKIGTGVAFILPSLVPMDSGPLIFAQCSAFVLGGGLLTAGGYQLYKEIRAEIDKKKMAYPDTSRFDNFARKLASSEEFFAGAAFAIAGLGIYCAGQTIQASDSSLVLSGIGMALMAAVAAKHFSQDYWPQILANLNK